MSLLNEFCREFGVTEADIGHVTRLGRRCFLTAENQEPLIKKLKNNLFGVGVYLGEEKQRFEPSAALLELIAGKTREHKLVVDERAAWLFLCGRDILEQGVRRKGEPTGNGFLLVQNEKDENLGYGAVPRGGRRARGVAAKNLLDRGFFLRRERLR
jgi:ribosome biogenesis protein Nip4